LATAFSRQTLTIFGDLASAGLVVDHGKAVTGLRRALKAKHLDRHRRRGLLDLLAAIVDQRAHPTPLIAGDEDVTRHQRAGLHQHCGDGATALVELGLDDDTFCRAVRIGLQVEDFGLQQDRLEQLVEIGALGRRHFDVQHLAAHRLDEDLMAQQFRAHFLRVGIMLVDLVDRHDDRDTGRLAWLIDLMVCGITLSSAATTRMAMSVAWAPRAHRREGGVAGCR
jgi:hypothetical protein